MGWETQPLPCDVGRCGLTNPQHREIIPCFLKQVLKKSWYPKAGGVFARGFYPYLWENNTGKTYAAYALYGFLLSWRGLLDFGVSEDQAQRLLTDGSIKIGLVGYVERAAQMFAEACERYIDQLDTILFQLTTVFVTVSSTLR